jgi:hypothetical protein
VAEAVDVLVTGEPVDVTVTVVDGRGVAVVVAKAEEVTTLVVVAVTGAGDDPNVAMKGIGVSSAPAATLR